MFLLSPDAYDLIIGGYNPVLKLAANINKLLEIFIAIDPYKFDSLEKIDGIVNKIIEDIKDSEPINQNNEIYYPGERVIKIREENSEKGIPVEEEIWEKIINL